MVVTLALENQSPIENGDCFGVVAAAAGDDLGGRGGVGDVGQGDQLAGFCGIFLQPGIALAAFQQVHPLPERGKQSYFNFLCVSGYYFEAQSS